MLAWIKQEDRLVSKGDHLKANEERFQRRLPSPVDTRWQTSHLVSIP